MEKQASFGFRDVPEQEKEPLVRGVFNRVAARYDIMNDLMSFGAHRLWKQSLVNALHPTDSMQLLDLAGGTGDISLRVLKRAPHARITLADINAVMLEEGRVRALDRGISTIHWVCGNAETLPFPDQHFDACVIAFGLRNVTHTDAALREIRRVLKTGGHFLCLEFSHVPHAPLNALYDFYSFRIIPKIGGIVAGDGEPYKYLVESIRRFPAPEKLAEMMQASGFGRVTWRPLSGTIVALHSGWRV